MVGNTTVQSGTKPSYTSWASTSRVDAFNNYVKHAHHDLAGPIGNVNNYAFLAEDQLKHPNANPKQILENLIQSMKALGLSLNGLFNKFMQGLYRGSKDYEKKPINLKDFKIELISDYQIQIPDTSGINLDITHTKSFDELVNFSSDKVEIKRVLDNLFKNALDELTINSKKYKAIDLKKIKIHFSYDKVQKTLQVDFTNSGRIDVFPIETVFDERYSTKKHLRVANHPSGVGLYGAKSICESLGGCLRVRNATEKITSKNKEKENPIVVFSALFTNYQD